MTEDINHYSLFNAVETVDGVGRSGFRPQTSPSPSHHSGDNGRSSDFRFMVITEVGIGKTPASFQHITMVD